MDAEFEAVVDAAVEGLRIFGRFWLPGYQAEEVEAAVKHRLPGREIQQHEPDPYDEHVLVDTTQDGKPPADLLAVSRRRAALREKGVEEDSLPR